MTLQRAINWVIYNGATHPTTGISVARWAAMVAHIRREYTLPVW